MYADGMTTASALPPEEPVRGQMVLLPTPPPGGFTAGDLPRLIEAVDARFELLDGEVLMMAPATQRAGNMGDREASKETSPGSAASFT
jgi:hypothetical protein